MQFDIDHDIDLATLDRRATQESHSIYNSSSAQGRTFDQIYKASRYGLAAEVYLMQHHKFIDNPEKYQDVISPTGTKVEVKVTSKQSYVQLVLEKCKAAKRTSYRNHPDEVYIFVCPTHDTIYRLHGIYVWDNTNFVRK